MPHRSYSSLLASIVLVLLTASPWGNRLASRPDRPFSIGAPVLAAGAPNVTYLPLVFHTGYRAELLWKGGGCYSSWCETGWYASPAVADVDKDGQLEVIGASYSTFALDAATGKQEWIQKDPGTRAWPGVVAADLEGDGKTEIVTAHGDGYVYVLNPDGSVRWVRQPTPGNELRSLAVADLDRDGKLEIVVASTRSEDQWMVYRSDGSPYPGTWPQLHGDVGYAAGAYNENIAIADLDHDGRGEIIGPSDVHYITAYQDNGAQIPATSRYQKEDGSLRMWSEVGTNVDEKGDYRGWTECDSELRPNFASTAPSIADLDGDGSLEVVVVGNVYSCATDDYVSKYQIPFIFNPDRSRWHNAAFDWMALPTPDAKTAPLSEDYNVIENNQPNPVLVDLDGDGNKEILYPSYDGRLHAYWLDKREHDNWPYALARPGESGMQFASEPAVADLNNDGRAEVIFTTWPEEKSGKAGNLIILDASGSELARAPLPTAKKSGSWNGGLAAPTLARLSPGSDLVAFINTSGDGFVAYTIPDTANARILWGTGRGSQLRNGMAP